MSAPSGISESPFIDVESFEASPAAMVGRPRLSSPFVEAFVSEDSGASYGQGEGARRVLLAELHDEEFDDALYELVGETSAYASNGSGSRLNTAALQMRLAPLAGEIESFIQRAADQFGSREAGSFSDLEIDDVMSRIGPERQLSPGFENFFSVIKNAVGKVAKGAVNLAKKGIEAAAKLGLGPILAKLKGLVRPLLERVLQSAISRLPASLQPPAQALAGKLPALFGMEVDPGTEGEQPALDVSAIQSEFNGRVADLLLGESSVETDSEASDWREPESGNEAGIADLDAARERFVADLERLDNGDDPGPAVERFVPALLPVLKLGLRIAGRKRVVSLLAGLVSKLIGKFVGPASSGALSAALVDAGLKLIGLEVSESDQRRTGHSAIAATVEETVRRVSELPDAVLENEALLEGSILRAFEDAAVANLPPMLSAEVYRRRPELSETDGRSGCWIAHPIRGPKRYKKFSRVFRTRISPRVAMTVTTFGEAPLAQFLQEQLGLDAGEELEADVHLYESLPGTLLGEVARLDANGQGAASIAEFHPLTPEAAGLLVREPGLGRPASASSLASPRSLAVGQRFFRVVVPGHRIMALPGSVSGARGKARRRTGVHTVLDFPGDRIKLYLYLSERRAQELATTLRKQGHAGAVATTLKTFIDRGVAAATSGHVTGRIRLIHEALSLDEARGAALARVPRTAVRAFASRIGEWTLTALTDYLGSQSPKFIAATEDAQDGVTVVMTLANPPGMAAMRRAVAGAPPNGDAGAAGAPGSIQVDVVPGFTNG
jgi:hypothetical protein